MGIGTTVSSVQSPHISKGQNKGDDTRAAARHDSPATINSRPLVTITAPRCAAPHHKAVLSKKPSSPKAAKELSRLSSRLDGIGGSLRVNNYERRG